LKEINILYTTTCIFDKEGASKEIIEHCKEENNEIN
jgi:hypothetical protein